MPLGSSRSNSHNNLPHYSGSSSDVNTLNSQGLEVESVDIREEIDADGRKKFFITSEIRVKGEENVLQDIVEEDIVIQTGEVTTGKEGKMANCPADPPNLHGRVLIEVENLETNPEAVKVRSVSLAKHLFCCSNCCFLSNIQ